MPVVQATWVQVVQTEFHGCTTEREPSTGPTETFVTLDSSCIPKTPPSPADPPADPGITVVNDSTLMVPPDVAGAAGGPLGVSRPASQSKARSQKDVCVTEGDMTKTSWPDFQKCVREGHACAACSIPFSAPLPSERPLRYGVPYRLNLRASPEGLMFVCVVGVPAVGTKLQLGTTLSSGAAPAPLASTPDSAVYYVVQRAAMTHKDIQCRLRRCIAS